MTYIPMTPFRRAADLVQIRRTLDVRAASAAAAPVDKWEALRVLRQARTRIGVSDRQLTVLQALLSFVPGTELRAGAPSCVVHPSNATICDRLNGMPCSTMRRHVAALVEHGLVARRDSPNGKRYVRRRGGEREVFGLDLSPLAVRMDDLRDAASAQHEEECARRDLRHQAALMRRDLLALVDCGSEHRLDPGAAASTRTLVADSFRALRRKLSLSAITVIVDALRAAVQAVRESLDVDRAAQVSTKDVEHERHILGSKEEESEGSIEPTLHSAGSSASSSVTCRRSEHDEGFRNLEPNLAMLIAHCCDVEPYADGPVRNWSEATRSVETVYPMMGISADLWAGARVAMGERMATACVLTILQRFATIRSPGGYLRKLTVEARAGKLSADVLIGTLRNKSTAGVHSCEPHAPCSSQL